MALELKDEIYLRVHLHNNDIMADKKSNNSCSEEDHLACGTVRNFSSYRIFQNIGHKEIKGENIK